MSSSSREHGRLGSLKAIIELCIFGPSLFGYNDVYIYTKKPNAKM